MGKIIEFLIGLIVMPIVEAIIGALLLLLPIFAGVAGQEEIAIFGLAGGLILNLILPLILLIILFFIRRWVAIGYLVSIIEMKIIDYLAIPFLNSIKL